MKYLRWKFIAFETLCLSPFFVAYGVIIEPDITPTFIPVFLVLASFAAMALGMINFVTREIK